MKDHEKRAEAHRLISVRRRILVGYIGLYPTLLLVLTILAPLTKDLSFPVVVLIEVVILVPLTQLVSFPLAGWLVAHLQRRKSTC